jgi:hypothetical protein
LFREIAFGIDGQKFGAGTLGNGLGQGDCMNAIVVTS